MGFDTLYKTQPGQRGAAHLRWLHNAKTLTKNDTHHTQTGEDENEQLLCIMEAMGLPPRHLLDAATRRKVFFDSAGGPRLQPNSRGEAHSRRRRRRCRTTLRFAPASSACCSLPSVDA